MFSPKISFVTLLFSLALFRRSNCGGIEPLFEYCRRPSDCWQPATRCAPHSPFVRSLRCLHRFGSQPGQSVNTDRFITWRRGDGVAVFIRGGATASRPPHLLYSSEARICHAASASHVSDRREATNRASGRNAVTTRKRVRAFYRSTIAAVNAVKSNV